MRTWEKRWLGFVILLCVALVVVVAVQATQDTSHRQKAAPLQTTPAAQAPAATQTTTFEWYNYQKDPQRVARIHAALQSFGAVVLQQAKQHGAWGPFDTYCSNIGEGGSNTGGWTSQGYKPVAGEDCFVQHNPQYGGSGVQVGADVLVVANGSYSNQFVGAIINDASCAVSVMTNHLLDNTLMVLVGKSPNVKSLNDVSTLAQAQALDDLAIACLNQTRP